MHNSRIDQSVMFTYYFLQKIFTKWTILAYYNFANNNRISIKFSSIVLHVIHAIYGINIHDSIMKCDF